MDRMQGCMAMDLEDLGIVWQCTNIVKWYGHGRKGMPRMQDRDRGMRASARSWIMGLEGLNMHGQL